MKLPGVTVPKKLVPAKAPAVLTKIAPNVFPESTAPSGGGSLSDPDDESTFFTFFSTIYLGMFGLTLLIWPSVHSQDGPFTTPMAYWTSMTHGGHCSVVRCCQSVRLLGPQPSRHKCNQCLYVLPVVRCGAYVCLVSVVFGFVWDGSVLSRL